MNTINQTMRPKKMFLGTPQTDKLQVFKVDSGRNAVLTQAILTNTHTEDAKLTLTINTVDTMKDLVVVAGETKILDLYIVLNEGDTVSLQQNTANAINVALNGQFC